MPRLFAAITIAFTLALTGQSARAEAPVVVTDIRPILGIATAMTYGITTPDVILSGNATPHDYAMRPSDAIKLRRADVVFWMGPEASPFLEQAMETTADAATVIDLSRLTGLTKLPPRHGGLWGAADDGHGDHGDPHDHEDLAFDPHLWLDPCNAMIIAEAMVKALVAADPAHAPNYRAKLNLFRTTLENTDALIKKTLDPVKDRPYLVLHDAFQYFEAAYGLNAQGAATGVFTSLPGARDVATLRGHVDEGGIACVVQEPDMSDTPVRMITGEAQTKIAVLDPLGRTLPPTPLLYPSLLKDIAAALRTCLTPDP